MSSHRSIFSARRRLSGQRGFTLIEAVVSVTIFTITMLGVYACLIKAYQLSQITRYNDQARSVLLGFVDQFERLETVDGSIVRPFFTPAQPTGTGITWPQLSNAAADPSAIVSSEDDVPIEITLGDDDTAGSVMGYLTRAVFPVNATTGELMATSTSRTTYLKAPGYMLMGVFTISYTLPSGRTYTQRLAGLRAVP